MFLKIILENSFENTGLFGFYFLKLFLTTVFENIKNTNMMFFKNYSCSLNDKRII